MDALVSVCIKAYSTLLAFLTAVKMTFHNKQLYKQLYLEFRNRNVKFYINLTLAGNVICHFDSCQKLHRP